MDYTDWQRLHHFSARVFFAHISCPHWAYGEYTELLRESVWESFAGHIHRRYFLIHSNQCFLQQWRCRCRDLSKSVLFLRKATSSSAISCFWQLLKHVQKGNEAHVQRKLSWAFFCFRFRPWSMQECVKPISSTCVTTIPDQHAGIHIADSKKFSCSSS